jgi:hypothetical protein
MSFLNKMKSGISDAGNKAKVMVEVNKLRLHNSGKQKEIEKQFQEIGNIVFLTSVGRELGNSNGDFQTNIDEILRLEREIEENRKQIKTLANEKDCVCGKPAPLDAKFCSSCGATFTE